MKDTSLSEGSQQTGSAGAQHIKSSHTDTDRNVESARKRCRWEQADEARILINFDFNRTISSSSYPPSEHLLSLAGSKVPLPVNSADLELSIKASSSASVQNMGHLKPSNFNVPFHASSYNNQRSLNSNHHHDLIARLLAAASVNSSRDPNVQAALHTLNHGQLEMPLLAYNLQQGKQYIEQQGGMTRTSNQRLTKVNPSTYTSQQGIDLRDHDIMSNTTLFKPYNNKINRNAINPYPYNNSKLHTIENKDKEEVGALEKGGHVEGREDGVKKVAMQKDVKAAMQKYVQVVMEGRSIERNVCLEEYDSYESFAKALFYMYGSTHDVIMNICPTPTYSLHNAIPGYKIAYEDYEGDLLLAGDLPWREFTRAAKQIKIVPVLKPKQNLSKS